MPFPRHYAVNVVLGILILLASLASVTGCGSTGAATSTTAGPTPSPTLEAQTLAFLTILHKDYELGLNPDSTALLNCGIPFGGGAYGAASAAGKAQLMKDNCFQPSTDTKRDAQALFDELSTVTAPARWQTADAEFKQAAQGMVAYIDTVLAAINSGSVSQFEATWPGYFPAWAMFCDPIHQTNSGAPLDYALNVPKAGTCG